MATIKPMEFIEMLSEYTNNWGDLCDCNNTQRVKDYHDVGCVTMRIRKDYDRIKR